MTLERSTSYMPRWKSSRGASRLVFKQKPVFSVEDQLVIWYWRHVFQIGILLYIVRKVTGIDFSCSDIQWTPKEWTSWLDINYNSFNLAWNGKTFKLELHEPNAFRDWGIFFSLFLSAEYVVNLANMVIMMMMIINLRVCCENIAKSLKKLRNSSCV